MFTNNQNYPGAKKKALPANRSFPPGPCSFIQDALRKVFSASPVRNRSAGKSANRAGSVGIASAMPVSADVFGQSSQLVELSSRPVRAPESHHERLESMGQHVRRFRGVVPSFRAIR